MSLYQFCANCPHIAVTMVNHPLDKRGNNDLPKVEERSCPARFSPYEPEEKRGKKNPYGCPRNEKFMAMKQKEMESEIQHYRFTL